MKKEHTRERSQMQKKEELRSEEMKKEWKDQMSWVVFEPLNPFFKHLSLNFLVRRANNNQLLMLKLV